MTYLEQLEVEMSEFLAIWPHRIDLKLPLVEVEWQDRKAKIYDWLKAQKADAIPGPVVPYDCLGYTHMTMWFKRRDLSLLCRLTWSGP